MTVNKQETAIFVTNRLNSFQSKDELFPCTGLTSRKIKQTPVYCIISRVSLQPQAKSFSLNISVAQNNTKIPLSMFRKDLHSIQACPDNSTCYHAIDV